MVGVERVVRMRPAENWRKWVVVSLLGLALSAQTIAADYSSIIDKFGTEAVELCNEKCPFQNRTGEGHFDLSCDSECSIQQCVLGCSLWKQGLEKTCQITCNVTSETVVSRELYCVMGCNEALNTYFQKLRDLIGTPPAPALVADSLTATSLSLLWEAPNIGNLTYLVQWRYEELAGTWQYYSNNSRTDRTVIHVENLRPYTKYRFRIAIFLSGRGGTVEPVYSAQSVVMSTLDSGKPSSPPSALRAAAPDSGRVAISWEPGPFPNGPLISYVLRLADTHPNTSYTALEDMPASNNTLFYMFENLSPAREYEVSVSMRNAVGEGARAVVRVSTPPLPAVIPSQQPILIIGGEQSILAAQANDMLSDPIELYRTEYNITGVGLDVTRDYLFVSISNGYVYRSSLSKKSPTLTILTPDSISYKPLDLSVDWLNKHLYMLGEVYYTKEGSLSPNTTRYSNWEILRCDFDGKNQLVALAGFNSRPIHFEVDPYNGYIFWALRGVERGGLYRLDLANISNGVHHDAPPELILRDAHLGAFTVDHTDFRLLVASRRHNTVLAVSLDGREVSDMRRNTQTPMFGLARSMAFAGGLFYWTHGKDMLTEEYHAKTDSYFHIEYPIVFNTNKIATRQVLVALRSCQPIPVPVNPPINVQSVMGISRAKVSWSPPHLLGHQGIGAWQQWEFHLQLTQVETGETINRRGINGTSFMVENLKENSEYIIKVAAATESGSGPWSSEFVGRTLASTPATLNSTLLWSGPDGLLQTDLTGDNMQTLIHRAHLKYLTITDISWYRDRLYLVTNASTVLWYNTTSHEKGLMPNMDNVGSIAVDWVGKRIYWSNPKQQLITRGNLEGGNREPVPIVTVAKELTIDSLGAYIYWNTGHAVEGARLNGENKMVYYPAQLFSGKQVMGLTADLEKKWLYWLVRSYDGSELHRAPTADRITIDNYDVSKSLVSRLNGPSTLGPLCYFSGRLVWVKDGSQAVVSDLAGRYTATLLQRVRVIAVREATLQEHSEELVAIPRAIDKSTIKVSGAWDKFNVTWGPASYVNHGRVYYDVNLHFHGHYKMEKTLDQPWVSVRERSVPPYSIVEASVRALTQWGGGQAVSVTMRTPQAAPAAPTNPRLFIQYNGKSSTTSAIFRWDPPNRANGVIRGFETQCWVVPNIIKPAAVPARPSECAGVRLPPEYRQLYVKGLIPNTTYYFQVRAHTDAGFGFSSDTVSSSSEEVNPIPRILMSSQEFIKVLDLDNGESETVPKIIGMTVDYAVSIEENVIYWANNLEEIFASRIIGIGHYKLSTINGSSSSVCVDWVGRAVYWAQHEPTSSQPHVIYRAQLGLPNTRARVTWVLATNRPIHNLQISPLTRTLYWYEEGEHPGFGTIITSRTDGSDSSPFFKPTNRSDICNCPENPQVARSFAVDVSQVSEKLYWIDPWVQQIVAADMNGCKCWVVVHASSDKRFGFPPVSITIDSKNIYWFNSTEKTVYYRDKSREGNVNQANILSGTKILSLDTANQPYPAKECLIPQATTLIPEIVTNSANSITLQLPDLETSSNCSYFDKAATEYTIYYQLNTNDTVEEQIMTVNTVDREVVLYNLLTFKNYTVYIEATNYYAKQYEMAPIKGIPVIVQTAAEAPTAAQDVTATVLSPVLARVEWTTKPDLWYQLYWATNESDHFQHKFQEHNTFPVSEGRAANMSHLSPNTSYVVWVRACSNYSKVYTDSKQISVHTYPLPTPIVSYKTTAYSIYVKWIPPTTYKLISYKVEYIEASSNSGNSGWSTCSAAKLKNVWSAESLRPRTRYRFRLQLQYAALAPPYYWPHDDRFVFITLGDVPGAPGAPRVEAVDSRILRAWWAEPAPHGHAITEYRVWGRPRHRLQEMNENTTQNASEFDQSLLDDVDDDFKSMVMKEGLVLLHNGTDNYWLISSEAVSHLSAGGWVLVVQARNVRGWGPLSAAGEITLPRHAAPQHATAALFAAAAALATLAAAVAAGLVYMYKNRSKKKAALQNQQPINVIRRGPDVELATLRQLPIRHSNNILYNQGVHVPSDAELAALPHIRREQITLHKFLGSGAFGEVFEGVARNIHGINDDIKVAVKTLRKGATEQEKTEFLQEAALMSNFKHEHILRLLGVCLDNDPNYIIMELMEDGDLLSYLRSKRASLYNRDSLTLLDLLNMCVDVTKGCRYLEEMHFVHRDLAARNCLVANRGGSRIVKIGDFGLARDIYRNDYYRKEGEGLLPIRWMAVECFVDGVFSCQSDVWAWAVLCWEVLSLGQQPYPARTNRHVLSYVRAGGTPDRPPNCPSVFYELLQKCWSYSPEQRPSFKYCLEVVCALRDKTSPNITLTAVCQPPLYLTLIASDMAVDNRTYLLDENDNACIDEDYPDNQMEPSQLLPAPTPKYLELMYDSDSGPGSSSFSDGYEIPRSGGGRHSIVGVAPRRLIRRPRALRSHSLRAPNRPTNATIIPLRNGIVKRASLCESLHGSFLVEPQLESEFDLDKDVKTPF